MFEVFGFANTALQEAYWVNETTFWKPSESNASEIERNGRILDTEPGLSEFPHLILNQARVHASYLQVMRNAPTRLEPDYGLEIVGLDRDDSQDFPLQVQLQSGQGESQTIRAKYVVGCDGARSAVRGLMGQKLVGDSANQAWGVMDILAVSDFPDVRLKTLVQSAEEGSAIIIPREGGHMIRIYIELDALAETERVKSKNITADDLVAAANRIFHPYSFDIKDIPWWSVYEIGQRLCPRFDDGEQQSPHIFIAGDACHTHSPKAGLGMNVSMGDAFNLGWKLAAVLEGRSPERLLETYSLERQGTAQELIDFDRAWSKMISAPPKTDENPDGVDPEDFRQYFIKHGRFTAGTAFVYQESYIVGPNTYQNLAPGFQIGKRFHSAPVVRLADAKRLELGHTTRPDGRWKMFVFGRLSEVLNVADEILDLSQRVPELDLRAVIAGNHIEVDAQSLPDAFRPIQGTLGLVDYEKVFTSDIGTQADIFEKRGIDPDKGCMIAVRPDQHVAMICPIADPAPMLDFLTPIFLMDR